MKPAVVWLRGIGLLAFGLSVATLWLATVTVDVADRYYEDTDPLAPTATAFDGNTHEAATQSLIADQIMADAEVWSLVSERLVRVGAGSGYVALGCWTAMLITLRRMRGGAQAGLAATTPKRRVKFRFRLDPDWKRPSQIIQIAILLVMIYGAGLATVTALIPAPSPTEKATQTHKDAAP